MPWRQKAPGTAPRGRRLPNRSVALPNAAMARRCACPVRHISACAQLVPPPLAVAGESDYPVGNAIAGSIRGICLSGRGPRKSIAEGNEKQADRLLIIDGCASPD